MRCEICDSTWYVGRYDRLCPSCRIAIKKSKRVREDITPEELIEYEHRSMNLMDTSVADKYTRSERAMEYD